MSCYTFVVLVTILLSVSADLTSLDCPLRQIGLDYAASLQPFRSLASLQEIADALNGAVEAANCSVKPKQRSGHSSSRVGWADLPSVQSGVNTIWCDPNASNDGDGSKGYPYLTIQRALEDVKEIRGKLKVAPSQSPFAIVLRSGVFYLNATINMDSSLGFVSFQSAPGEHAAISGAVPILDVKWLPFAPPPRDAYETKQGCLSQQFDAPVAGGGIIFSAHVAAGMCDKTTVCAGFIINAQTRMVYFKTEVFWQPRSTRGKACAAGPAAEDLGTVYIKNYGYTAVAKGSPNLFVADLSGLGITADITGLRIAGQRQIRARYPNARTVEQINSMQVIADEWTSPPTDHGAASYYNPSYPARMDSVFDTRVKAPFFSTFKLGIGGPCAERFTPQASYWCSNASEGGGPGQYEAPVGFSVSNANESLPHLGTYEDIDAVKGAIVHTWRRGRWYSWAFEVDEFSYDASNSTATFGFSLERGGNQGSRGGTAGQEFMIENVLDELDSPGEFFFDSSAQKLYVWHNVTTSTPTPPPNAGEVTATQLRVLFNISGASQSDPVKNVSFTGIVFKDTALTYMDPHGTPSGGDWAVTRAAALYFENTENTLLSKSLLSTLDGHAVFLSGYNRGAVIDQNEFVGIGETAISQWGYTDGSPVPGMGWDARSGNQPRGTRVTYNLVHEVGVWAKQNSFYFQSESFMNHIEGNIAYNGPRAGINFDDGMGGGSNVTRNVLFNFCRESADHGTFRVARTSVCMLLLHPEVLVS